MVAPQLAPELIDEIIDHLHDDMPSLSSCSRVCKTWTPAAQFHLFHSIVAHAVPPLDKETYDGAIFTRFSDFVNAKEAEKLLPYVRELRFDPGLASLKPPQLPYEVLCAALLKLPSLHTLTLHYLELPPLPETVPALCHRLRSLNLKKMIDDEGSRLVGILRCFNVVDRLSIDYHHWTLGGVLDFVSVEDMVGWKTRVQNFQHYRRPLVSTLKLIHDSAYWALSLVEPRALTSLYLDVSWATFLPNYEEIGAFLYNTSSGLLDLTLDISGRRLGEDILPYLANSNAHITLGGALDVKKMNIACCKNVVRLTVAIALPDNPNDDNHVLYCRKQWDDLVALLSDPPSSVRHLTIDFRRSVPAYIVIRDYNWSSLDAVLACREHLEEVSFACNQESMGLGKPWLEFLTSCLPRFRSMGNIHVL
ncbi:unnamed protein product [Somion occarium]|uniref:F-box domain-containing protein n=1 Tax=Somion occarium TaxID=3059160 RepID=A0ABP1DDQ4_9APHY